jgi:hypothetical protein
MKKLIILIMLLFPILLFSQTKNIVPRADGEGKIGTSAKAWGKVYADSVFLQGISLNTLFDNKQNAMGSNDNYVSDAQLIVIGNTLGVNTGDNATNSQYSGLATSKQNTLVSGSNIKTVNGSSILGSGDLTVTATLDTPTVRNIIDQFLADSAYTSIYTGGETDSLLTIVANNDVAWSAKADTSGQVWTGVHDFGGATSIEIPSGANPTTDATGEIAIDTDDKFIEFYDGALSRVIPNIQIANYTILYPDTVQARSDDVILAHFPAEIYPHGITITYVCISASASATDTHVLEEWSDAIGTSQGTVESLALSTATKIESTSIDDATIAADAYLNINLDGTPDNINWIQITIGYYVNQGD